MLDFLFDPIKREIVLAANGDFVTTANPSIQDGAALLYSKGTNLLFPMAGVNINQIINGGAGVPTATFELNRWKAQAYNDGATNAKWTSTPAGRDFAFTCEISYL